MSPVSRTWHFQDRTGLSITEPIQGEFFASDATSDLASALVREGIQNSLDASAGGAIRVRIFLSDRESAVAGPDSKKILGGLHPHLRAEGNGIRSGRGPRENSRMPYLLFECFGTSGLTGDPVRATRPADSSIQDNFYYFFRHDGKSAKDDKKIGSWGVGKFVFYRASRINTIIALTVLQDTGEKLLLGRSILRSHHLEGDEGQTTHLDGYLGQEEGTIGRGFRVPIDSPEEIDAMTSLLDIQRVNEPGLSILVPYPDEEIESRNIRKSVIRDYFYPIVNGDLVVDLDLEGDSRQINNETIMEEVEALGADGVQDIIPIIELAIWAIENGEQESIRLDAPDPARAPSWSSDGSVASEEMIARISERLKAGTPVSIRVPITLQHEVEGAQETFFDLYLAVDADGESKRPTVLRDGIIITAAKSHRTKGLHALISVSDDAMASFIRMAENPSHTEVSESRLKTDYNYHAASLRYLLSSVQQLNNLISGADEEENFELFSDFFSDRAIQGPRVRTRNPDTGPTPGPDIPPSPDPGQQDNWYQIGQIKRGFSLTPGPAMKAGSLPRELVILTGYGRRRRNAITSYRVLDFDLGDTVIFDMKSSGCEVIERTANRIRLRVNEIDFKLTVRGYNENRQVEVRANEAGDNA